MKGVEVLFISGAVGTLVFVVFKVITPLIIDPLIGYYTFLPTSFQILPIAPNMSWPIEGLRDTSAIFIVNAIVLSAILWLIFSSIFYIFIKSIQFCLDPDKSIFTTYSRFSKLKEYNIPHIAAIGIPLLMIYCGLLIYFGTYAMGFLLGILDFGFSSFRGMYHIGLSIFAVFISLIIIYFTLKFLIAELKCFIPIFKKIDSKNVDLVKRLFDKIDRKKTEIGSYNSKCNTIDKWIINHLLFSIIILIILIACFLFLLHYEGILFPMQCSSAGGYTLCAAIPP
jgi:hypothetical protein